MLSKLRIHKLRALREFSVQSLESRTLLSAVTGFVFNDINRDGIYNGSEYVAWNRTIWLDLNNDGALDTGEPSVVTPPPSTGQGYGTYRFDGLTPGTTYHIRTIIPENWLQTLPANGAPLDIVAPQENLVQLGANFGTHDLTQSSKISGYVFNDLNGDTRRGSTNEVRLEGQTVYVDSDNDKTLDAGELSTTTDSTGLFVLNPYNAGATTTYNVRVAPPAGWSQTLPRIDASQTFSLGLNAATTVSDYFGIRQSRSISGTLYFDADRDGTVDAGDYPLASRTVGLDTNNDGKPELSAVTDSDGNYRIGNITATGTAFLSQTLPTGWRQTGLSGSRTFNFLTTTLDYVDQDFLSTDNYNITGTVFDDTNFNGVPNTGEKTLVPGRTVFLDDNKNGFLDTGERSFTTNVDGFYFAGLKPGTYNLALVVPPGYVETTSPNVAKQITLPYAEVAAGNGDRTGVYLGLGRTGNMVTGTVFFDQGTIGVRDSSDAVLPNAVVYVDANNNGLKDTGELSATTDSTGGYRITDVPAGTQRIRLQYFGTYAQTLPTEDTPRIVQMTDGATVAEQNFGTTSVTYSGGVSGVVFGDANGNGVRDAGEVAVAGTSVWFDLDNDRIRDTDETIATTDSSGRYGLAFPAGKTSALLCVLTTGGYVSTDIASTYTLTVTRPTGQIPFSQLRNIGLTPAGPWVSGVVYDDANGNGVRDTGEVGLANRRVYVDANSSEHYEGFQTEISVFTAADGSYTLGGVWPNSTYAIRVDNSDRRISQPSAATAGQYKVSSSTFTQLTGKDFGLAPISTGARLTGRVFYDGNRNGTFDTSESGSGSGEVYVDFDNDSVLDANEPRVSPDQFGYVNLDLTTAQFNVTSPTVVRWDIDSNVSYQTAPSLGRGMVVNVTPGGTTSGLLFGYIQSTSVAASITGAVFNDANGDGNRQNDEAGLSGRVVFIDADADKQLDLGERSTLSNDSGGNYTFLRVNPAPYQIVSLPPAGWSRTVPSDGVRTVNVTSHSAYSAINFGQRNSTTPVTLTLRSEDDSYVRDGTYATQNFGSSTELAVKRHSSTGNTRETYLTFPISAFSGATSAKLRLFGRSNTTGQSIPVSVYGVADVSWYESQIKWNGKPAAGATSLASKTISGTTNAWFEFDVTTYVKQQRAAGATFVSFALKSTANGDAQAIFSSGETTTTANRPQLVVLADNTGTPPPIQEIVLSNNVLTVPEGSQASITVRLAAKPATNVTVDVIPGILVTEPHLNLVGPTKLIFTPTNWSTPQAVAFSAAQDPDVLKGQQAYLVLSDGLATRSLTVKEADDDTVPQPGAEVIYRSPDADAYVRDGASAGTNFGQDGSLVVQKSSTTGENRETYLRFNIAGADAAGATIRLFGRSTSATEPVVVSIYGTSATGWEENALTWNNKPALGNTLLGQITISGTTSKWYEIKVTGEVNTAQINGKSTVAFILKSNTATAAQAIFESAESATTANRPILALPQWDYVFSTQELIVSKTSLSVAERGSSSFTVKLNRQPLVDTIVTITRNAGGDSDLTATPTTLVFKPSNWSVAQTVTINAANDADALNGSATFTISMENVASKTVTATETDNNTATPTTPTTLRAIADAYVRDGSYAGQNFGSAAELQLKKNSSAGSSRDFYLKFDIASLASVGTAKLRLNGKIDHATQAPRIAIYAIDDSTWGETSINWNNRPPAGVSLATAVVAGSTAKWYEFDVSSYVKGHKISGQGTVTFVVRVLDATEPYLIFSSDEAAANRPELVVTPDTGTPPPLSIVVSKSQLAVNEGSTGTFTVKLSKRPANEVFLTVERTSGDSDLTASGTALPAGLSLHFDPDTWDIPQTVTIAAGQDADAINGTATFKIEWPTMIEPTFVTVTEVDDDAVTPPVGTPITLRASADAHVRDGSYATQNFGSTTELQLKKSTAAGSSREFFLKFDLSNQASISAAKLRLWGRIDSATEKPQVAVYGASNSSWAENTINWNNRPAATGNALATVVVATSTAKWYEFDVTAFLKAQKTAGATSVTLVVRSLAATEPYLIFSSDEAASNRPELIVTA